jgi:hypothetical protein
VGIALDKARAADVLDDALELAHSDSDLPELWLERTEVIAACASKTFTVALATGLLARATNGQVDPLALKATSGDRAYSARSLAHDVLVPFAKRNGIDIRATGREPLNNQPFFRYDRVDEFDRVHPSVKDCYPKLVDYLRDVDPMTSEEARHALAAFIRSRIAAKQRRQKIRLGEYHMSVDDVIKACRLFVSERSESGKRAQALVAAVFDVVFEEVKSDRVFSPSRREPGDVRAYRNGELVVAAEVRDKAVTHSDAMAFAASLEAKSARTGVIVVLEEDAHGGLDRTLVLLESERDYGVTLTVIEGVLELISEAITWSGAPAAELLEALPRRALVRLEEIEVEDESLARWAELTASAEVTRSS